MHGVVKRRCIALENSASIDCLAVNLIWFHEFISIQPLKFEASVLGRTKEKIQIIQVESFTARRDLSVLASPHSEKIMCSIF